jgi:3,4-dihydroxy 2-butanone 4-phosphate synthase/GTP cyclohydrolase II
VADIISYRLKTETFVKQVAESVFPTEFGDFRIVVFENRLDKDHHIALVRGVIGSDAPVLVRVHSQSTMADVFGPLRRGNGSKLHTALKKIQEAGAGILVYLRQEEKGEALVEEIQSYGVLEDGADPGKTYESNSGLDLRIYGIGAQILRALGARKIRLLSNHPKHIVGLQGYGIKIVDQVHL